METLEGAVERLALDVNAFIKRGSDAINNETVNAAAKLAQVKAQGPALTSAVDKVFERIDQLPPGATRRGLAQRLAMIGEPLEVAVASLGL